MNLVEQFIVAKRFNNLVSDCASIFSKLRFCNIKLFESLVLLSKALQMSLKIAFESDTKY